MSWLFTFCNAGFKTTTWIFAEQDVEGWENVPKEGPLIFVANHLSNMDPPIVAALTGRKPGFLAKEELFRVGMFSYLLRLYGAHPLKRGTSDVRALRWATQRLSRMDGALILFPEGTRSRNGEGLRKALPGAAHLALKTRATIVPIGLTGTERLQNMFKVLAPRSKQKIKIGKPFRLAEPSPDRPSREHAEAITTEIMVRIARLLPETYQGYYRGLLNAPYIYTQ